MDLTIGLLADGPCWRCAKLLDLRQPVFCAQECERRRRLVREAVGFWLQPRLLDVSTECTRLQKISPPKQKKGGESNAFHKPPNGSFLKNQRVAFFKSTNTKIFREYKSCFFRKYIRTLITQVNLLHNKSEI